MLIEITSKHKCLTDKTSLQWHDCKFPKCAFLNGAADYLFVLCLGMSDSCLLIYLAVTNLHEGQCGCRLGCAYRGCTCSETSGSPEKRTSHPDHLSNPPESVSGTWEKKKRYFNMTNQEMRNSSGVLSMLCLRQWSGAKSVLLSGSDIPGASQPAPSPSQSAPGKNRKSVAGQRHLCQNTCPGENAIDYLL